MSMDRTDSTAAMASLAAYSMESDSDEEKPAPSAVDTISDDEHDTPTPKKMTNTAPSSRPPSSLVNEDETSRSDFESTDRHKNRKKKAKRLVSYGADELDDEGESSESSSDEGTPASTKSPGHGKAVVEGKIMNSSLNVEQASSLSTAVMNKSYEEIELPQEPTSKCSRELQDKIAGLYERKIKEGLDLNRNIQNRVDFRNPSIYEKLIEFCGIDEKGTNYPPELYDPSIWGKESFYDQLDKAQKLDMEKREKEKKERTKVEFVTATKKPGSKTEIIHLTGGGDDKKRKSKWDDMGQTVAGSKNITVAHLTATATGTKSTVIPATGSISKKAK